MCFKSKYETLLTFTNNSLFEKRWACFFIESKLNKEGFIKKCILGSKFKDKLIQQRHDYREHKKGN